MDGDRLCGVNGVRLGLGFGVEDWGCFEIKLSRFEKKKNNRKVDQIS